MCCTGWVAGAGDRHPADAGHLPQSQAGQWSARFHPNNFVRVRVPTSAAYQAMLVSPEAVGTDQDLKYIFVVDEENKVVRHAVKLGSMQDGLQVVTEGLSQANASSSTGLQRVAARCRGEPQGW